jgi:HAD superfamily phosphatase
VRYVLERRLGLVAPPCVAMGDAPDKPDPTGLLRLAAQLLAGWGLALGAGAPPVAYLGDTVADVETVQRARRQQSDQRFWSLAVAPPHLHGPEQCDSRISYEARLQTAGADRILARTADVGGAVLELVGG